LLRFVFRGVSQLCRESDGVTKANEHLNKKFAKKKDSDILIYNLQKKSYKPTYAYTIIYAGLTFDEAMWAH
jgi:hypothetical protein